MSLDPTAFAALTGILGVAIGAAINATLNEWTSRRREASSESRVARAAEASRQLEALRQTRRRVHHMVQQLKDLTIKPARWKQSDEYEVANDALIGDADVIRDYRELLVDLQRRFGQGLPIELSRRAGRVLAEIDQSISRQQERVRRGEPPMAIGQDLAEELFDMDALAERLLAVNQPPALHGLLARAYLDVLRLAASTEISNRFRFGQVRAPKAIGGRVEHGDLRWSGRITATRIFRRACLHMIRRQKPTSG